jgi:hypothetical protein
VPPVATVAHADELTAVAPTVLQTAPTIQPTFAIQPGSRGEPTDDAASVAPTATVASTAPKSNRGLLSPILNEDITKQSPCAREFCRFTCWIAHKLR